MPSCSQCQASVRADDSACASCGAALGHQAQGAPAGAFTAAKTLPRFEGSAALALGAADDRRGDGDDALESPPSRASRPPTAPAATETGRFPAHARPTPSGQTSVRPPILASEALRRDLAPSAPGASMARSAAVAVGLIGVLLTFAVTGARGFGIPVGGALLMVAALGFLPLPYAARASALAAVAGSGLAVVSWHALAAHALDLDTLVLRVGVLVLAMALLFRAWHRASLLARALVALGIALCAGGMWMSRALGALLVLDGGVQSWLAPLSSVALALLLMLSLLAFMDSRTTGGCAAWASLLLGWSVLHGGIELLERAWRAGAPRPSLAALPPEVWLALGTAPLFGAALSIALAQLLAVATAAEPA